MRGVTPFYLTHGWDPRSTLEIVFPLESTKLRDQNPRRWHYNIQRKCQRARAAVNERLNIPIQDRADRHNSYLDPAGIEAGSQYGCTWIGYKKDMLANWRICGMALFELLRCTEIARYDWKLPAHRIDYSRWCISRS